MSKYETHRAGVAGRLNQKAYVLMKETTKLRAQLQIAIEALEDVTTCKLQGSSKFDHTGMWMTMTTIARIALDKINKTKGT